MKRPENGHKNRWRVYDVFKTNDCRCVSAPASKKQPHTSGAERSYLASSPPPPPSRLLPLSLLALSLHLLPSTSRLIPSFFAHPSLSPPSLLPSFSHPRRGRDLIIISQARPYQETWLLMREKSILLSLSTSFSSASLSLPQSIYPPSLFFN